MEERETVIKESDLVSMEECMEFARLLRTSPANMRRILRYNVITVAQAAQLLEMTPQSIFVICKPQRKGEKVYHARVDTVRLFNILNRESELDLMTGTQFVLVNEKFLNYFRLRLEKGPKKHKNRLPRHMKKS